MVILSSVTSGDAVLSSFDCVGLPKDTICVSDVKGRVRLATTPRSLVPSASINLGKENVHVTMIPKLISAVAHKPSPIVLKVISAFFAPIRLT